MLRRHLPLLHRLVVVRARRVTVATVVIEVRLGPEASRDPRVTVETRGQLLRRANTKLII
jgi:hypothetical protein